ncbi:ATP-binding protein [Alicyclobacillus fastidiosus]|uniref:histidine kinase n=1 Tax=Alicyclobacillus fastidiosus TaxID=392011 RepID=A0ABV5AH82_9BACL|nr:ATP-binding protein [Alicyclobacillus fastidiosus]WEH07853.1 ATP-binding protein [Alicyclobacillus fastidiosus]
MYIVNKDTEHSLDNHNATLNRLAAIGEVSAGIAHEIRNPLTAVKGFLQLMERDYPSPHWSVVQSELEQAIGTVHELLSVSKPNLVSEPKTQFSLCAIVENILSLFHKEMYRVKVHKRFHHTKAMVYGKQNQVKRAIFNLLKNAFEAIENEGTIVIEHHLSSDSVVLTIRDTGSGIPEDKLHLLGTPFFTTKETGTGLGLSQVYSTFYEHNADITVESNSEGTVFTITFPTVSTGFDGSPVAELTYVEGETVKEFFRRHREQFNESMKFEAKTTFEIVSQSKLVSTSDLLEHANQILDLIHDGLTQEVIALAQERGIVWAQSDIPIISKMEWFYALRKVIWRFLRFFHINAKVTAEEAFDIADRISDTLDNFVIHFNVSFTRYRDNIVRSQQTIIDELTVPVIPLFNHVAVLPLIGVFDDKRIEKIEERLLDDIESKGIQKLFIDLSGAVIADADIVELFRKVFNGVSLLGCATVLTGIRAATAKVMLKSELDFSQMTVESTLQQALAKESANGLVSA